MNADTTSACGRISRSRPAVMETYITGIDWISETGFKA